MARLWYMSEINGRGQCGHAHHFEHECEDHEQDHSQERNEHDTTCGRRGGIVSSTIVSIFNLGGHTHKHGNLAHDKALKENELGIRTIYIVIALLGLTTVFQIVIYLMSGSIALLGDTVHNFGDAIISIPLLFAFWLANKRANKRYTYGYGRAEDLAGLFIVLGSV